MLEESYEDPRMGVAAFKRGGANTVFSYFYRDANNYKQDESVVLCGPLTLDQARSIVCGTDDEDGFVPSAVGLDDLQERTIDGWNKEVDHPFHEVSLIALTNRSPTFSLEAENFYVRFLTANWEAEGERVVRKYAE